MSGLEAKVDALLELVQYLVEREEAREKEEKFRLECQMQSQQMVDDISWNRWVALERMRSEARSR